VEDPDDGTIVRPGDVRDMDACAWGPWEPAEAPEAAEKPSPPAPTQSPTATSGSAQADATASDSTKEG
jgi:hypothetical protein